MMTKKHSCFLALSIPLLLVACTLQHQANRPAPLPQRQTLPKQLDNIKLGQALVQTAGTTEEVTFQIQHINTNDIAFVKLTLVGAGITGTLTNDGSTFIPVTGGKATGFITNVPMMAGAIRIVSAQGYDSNKTVLPAFVAKGYYRSTTTPRMVIVHLSRRQLLTGLVLEKLLTTNTELLNSLNLTALQTNIDTAIGYNGTTFATDPLHFNVNNLVNLIVTGGIPTATQITTNAAAPPQNVTVFVKTPGGGSFCDTLEISINDPKSTIQTISGGVSTTSPVSKTFSVSPGTWTLSVKKSGTVVASTTVTVSATGSVTLDAGSSMGTALNAASILESVTGASTVSTIAGNGTFGFSDGVGTEAMFANPLGITVDSAGNLYVTDSANRRIRKITSDGTVSTFAGNGATGFSDGVGTEAMFNGPTGITVDSAGNLYVADSANSRIRKITSDGTVTTIAGNGSTGFSDGVGTEARFAVPSGITVDSTGNLYVTDIGNHSIRKIDTGGTVTTIAGNGATGFSDGVGTTAMFANPFGITVDSAGNLYVADRSNHRIRKINTGGTVTTIAGNGTSGFSDGVGTEARFANPLGITVSSAGNLYVADRTFRIRKINTGGTVTTIAGNGTSGFSDGIGTTARFVNPFSITTDSTENLYVADRNDHRIRKITSNVSCP